MNDAELRQLLQNADRSLIAGTRTPTNAYAFINRIQSAAAKAKRSSRRRRRAIAIAIAPLIVFAATATLVHRTHLPTRVASISASGKQTVDISDRETARCEDWIAAVEASEQLARLKRQIAEVRDPLADVDERGAERLLRMAENSPQRGTLLAAVVQQFPSTISASVARREMKKRS